LQLPSKISSILQGFNTFSLAELEAANLLERKDFKYIIKLPDFAELLQQLPQHYKVLSIKECRYTNYVTKYFDTPDFKFYTQHHNGQLNRYKVRLREYVESKLCFYEVKFKNNKNWTSKHRQRIDNLAIDPNNYLANDIQSPVEAKLDVLYTRITLLSNNGEEKITFDLNLTFNNDTKQKAFHDLVIAEVKSKTHHPYIFRQLAKKLGYRSMGISKYCFGITQIYQQLKNNNFKSTILKIYKLAS
jgi:hypothetical protein